MPQFSIIIPVYNTEKYLHQCLDSVINQTLKDIEIVVINDRSPGNCREIVEEYKKNDARIKYIEHKTNKGAFAARQTGVWAASGEFTRFLDSDDWLDMDTCAIIYDELQKAGADILYHAVQYEISGEFWYMPFPTNGYETLSHAELLNQIFEYRYTWDSDTKAHATCCCTFKTPIIQKALKEWNIQKRLVIFEDFLVTVGVICNSPKCVCIDNKLYHYRIGNGISYAKLTPEQTLLKFWDQHFIIQKTREILLSKNLWTKKYDDRAAFEFVHLFRHLQGVGPQFLKNFFSLLNPDDISILISLYLDVKNYHRKQRLKKPYIPSFYASGIINSLLGIFYNIVSLVLSLLNKFLQIIGIGKRF